MRWLGEQSAMPGALAAFAALLALGCAAPHITLEAPPPSAAPETRLEAYDTLRRHPEDHQRLRLVTGNSMPGVSPEYILLNRGAKVYYPTDLLPAVAPDSATATNARQWLEARESASTYTTLGTWVLIGTPVLTAVSFAALGPETEDGEPNIAIPLTILVAGLGGGLTSLVVGWVHGQRSAHARTSAFELYDDDLRQRLDLCEVDGRIGPCERLEQAPAPRATEAGWRF